MKTNRPVVVKHLPERLNMRQSRAFLREVQTLITADRPQIVFELSQVKQLDAAGVDMLLQCMSEVMKHDGDMKLAAVSTPAAVVLELTRTDRLFEIYENASDAVRSFSRFVPSAMRNQPFGGTVTATAATALPESDVVSAPGDGSNPDMAA